MAFIAAALMITLLIFTLALAIAFAQEKVVETLRSETVKVKRAGGWILIAVGTWLILLSIWAKTFTRIFPV